MSKRDHIITTTFLRRPDGGLDMVCGTCGRPVGTTAFKYGRPTVDLDYWGGPDFRRPIKDFLRHYGKAP